eukprot:gnl/TRDRNA2_/TRDRNA2_62537_c0_seq1.p1 gnl/TRDRNA2_/TRDRNA2_62537_c0~~gnl/TRDRNA2_/TRDRNA2_62537_c0_seq1.p1  ORF type:complete len:395 (+),score=49.54 gnl/TRDRNA2_/TRDRNA2_62537_c0_seq1:59-1243(+)
MYVPVRRRWKTACRSRAKWVEKSIATKLLVVTVVVVNLESSLGHLASHAIGNHGQALRHLFGNRVRWREPIKAKAAPPREHNRQLDRTDVPVDQFDLSQDKVGADVSTSRANTTADSTGNLNAMYDTIGAVDRPSLWASLAGRDKLKALFLAHGVLVSVLNILGAYTKEYDIYGVGVAVALGLSSAVWGGFDLVTGRIADDHRPGFAHERTIETYANSYLSAALWLSLRFSPLYPVALAPADPALCVVSIATYLFGLVAPVYTVVAFADNLTNTEHMRMRGTIASGMVGSVFILETSALLLNGGQNWWERVVAIYPSQNVLEPSVTLFAAYASEAGMFIHRCARRGVITFAQAVRIYAAVVLPLLTLLPMGSLFWWKREEVSFWAFLFLGSAGS